MESTTPVRVREGFWDLGVSIYISYLSIWGREGVWGVSVFEVVVGYGGNLVGEVDLVIGGVLCWYICWGLGMVCAL